MDGWANSGDNIFNTPKGTYRCVSLRGKPVRVRVTWTHNTPNTAHWEQAFSADGGKTWEINWTTDFVKADLSKP